MHRASLPPFSHMLIALCTLIGAFGFIWTTSHPLPFTILTVDSLNKGLAGPNEERYDQPFVFVLSSPNDISALQIAEPKFAETLGFAHSIDFERDLVLLVAPGTQGYDYQTVVRGVSKGLTTVDVYADFELPPGQCTFWNDCVYRPMQMRYCVLLTIPRSAVDQTITIVRLHSPNGTVEAPITH